MTAMPSIVPFYVAIIFTSLAGNCWCDTIVQYRNWSVPVNNEIDVAPEGICVKGDCLLSTCLAGTEFDDLKISLNAKEVSRSLNVTISMGNWLSTQLASTIARILLHEIMGYSVNIFYTTNFRFEYQRVALGVVTLNLEVWGTADTPVAQYFTKSTGLVRSLENGIIAKEGLYMPNYMFKAQNDTILSHYAGYYNLNNLNVLTSDGYTPDSIKRYPTTHEYYCPDTPKFWGPTSHCSSGKYVPPQCYPLDNQNLSSTCSEILLATPSWSTALIESVIRNLRLNFTITYVGTDAAEVMRRYDSRIPMIFYWFEPDLLLLNYPSSHVYLPPFTQACLQYTTSSTDPELKNNTCDYRKQPLIKLISTETFNSELDLATFYQLYHLTVDQLYTIMNTTGNTVEEMACNWIKHNTAVWSPWMSNVQNSNASCDEGYYQARSNNRANMHTECYPCSPGTYNINLPRVCKSCPLGAICPGRNMIYAQPGYWQLPNTTLFYECDVQANCPSVVTITLTSDFYIQACATDRNASTPLCGKCNNTLITYRQHCSECTQVNKSSWVIVVVISVVAILWYYQHPEAIDAAIDVLFDYYQLYPAIVSMYGQSDHYSSVLYLQIQNLYWVSQSCIFWGSPVITEAAPLIILSVIMFVFVGVITVHYLLRGSYQFQQYRYENMLCNLLTLTYSTVVHNGLNMQNCRLVGTTWVLRVNNSVECSASGAYPLVKMVYIGLISVVTVIPIWLMKSIHKIRNQTINDKYSANLQLRNGVICIRKGAQSKMLRFVEQTFLKHKTNDNAWFVCYFMIRRTALLAATAVAPIDQRTLWVVLLVSTMLVIQLLRRPYQDDIINTYYTMTLVFLLLSTSLTELQYRMPAVTSSIVFARINNALTYGPVCVGVLLLLRRMRVNQNQIQPFSNHRGSSGPTLKLLRMTAKASEKQHPSLI